ncbi:MAG TPA: 50S ribosomal protein L29 [Candidatus Saccharimonadales bacterium]|nr:50S ribosomal protein L29 [Candidatus Saccharimonadales bacterium]
MSKQEEKKVMTVAELRQELAEAKRSHKMGELKNTAHLRELRVAIARALTTESADKKVEEK